MSRTYQVTWREWCRNGLHASDDAVCASCSSCFQHCDCLKPEDDDPAPAGGAVAVRIFPVTEEEGELHVLRLARAKELSAQAAGGHKADALAHLAWAHEKTRQVIRESSRINRLRAVAREGSEARAARLEESEDEKQERWAREREERARQQSGAWQWQSVPEGWIVQTGSHECSLVQGYLVRNGHWEGAGADEFWVPASCTCPDFVKRGKEVECKHITGLRLHLEDLMDQDYKKAA